ncbi:MAG TPA: AMP-binding protein [Actinomycetota bacterium]|nr:AMP-binding protein [Actinomycetota bacterium]
MRSVVLLTGATGFLGTEIARRLLERPAITIVALVQAGGHDDARRVALRAWHERPELRAEIGDRIGIVVGDVTLRRLGLDDEAYARLVGDVTHVVHAAANVRFDGSLDDLRRTNVTGTANVLELARAAHRDHRLERFLHVSTAYVAGRRTGLVREDELTDRFGFDNAYERTKFEAERLVVDVSDELPVTIVRPGMIVGDSRSGEITTFNTVYLLLRRYVAERHRLVPARAGLRVNVVPVDHVADATVRLLLDERAAGATVHLTAPSASLPTAREVLGSARAWMRSELGVTLPRPSFVPLPTRVTRGSAGMLDVVRPYLRERRVFDRTNADRLLGPGEVRWDTTLPALFGFATERGFLHRTGRTVHEQAMFRLRSRRLPVRYVDVVDGVAAPRSAAAVRADVVAAARRLRSVGVGPGVRVAIVGPNGTRYLTLDLALGLLGAVTVPLYPTSPPEEIDDILERSGAAVLAVGSPQILHRLGPTASALRAVSFCREPAPAGVLGWADLVADRGEARGLEQAPVDLDDVATLRYTSGTTGSPKGVAFTHGQLRWMADTMASLVPWRARTRPVSYVSFLPMNHVVEGILGTYGAYSMPAPVEVTFVEELTDVPGALRAARPTVFFSVPRFYEKLRSHVAATSLGRRAVRMRPGPAKRAIAALVRRTVLRRAGLDRCAQLIVGSAPVAHGLLEDLHELGIEVHDAYGLTEAPLLTLSRVGRNRIGTAGEPLPGTTIRIADDGEILARGPQVTIGYADEAATQPFRDGWLATGDLGRIDDGFLVIEGRKKELLKTAYGKYLNPTKIEARLLAIPGVTSAMVVGEGRPCCAALLWTDLPLDEATRSVEAAMRRINDGLSHPEQVKRWIVLPDELTVAGGDLTPNLKLRRRRVAARYAAAIEAMYARREVTV